MTLSIVIIPFKALLVAEEPYGLLEVGFVLFKTELCFLLFTRILGIEV